MNGKHLLCACLLFPASIFASVTVVFQPASPSAGPFPSDALTVSSASQKTGRQINFPTSSCEMNPALSSCVDAALLNQLDGFSVNSQIVVCFSGPVNAGTLAGGIHIYPLARFAASIAINQILYDPMSNCMYAKPDQVLNQQSPYLLAITNSVLDSQGNKVQADPQFTACLSGGSVYCSELSSAVGEVEGSVSSTNLAGASVFTTLTATDWVEKAHAFVNLTSTPIAALPALPPPNPSQFPLSQLSGVSWIPDYGKGQPTIPQSVPLSVLTGVDSIAFGFFLSPNFINVSGTYAGTITVTPTGLPIAGPVSVGTTGFPAGYVPVSFHVFLPPARLMPPGGFPVVIYGHGLADSQFGASTFIAATLASAGIATLSFEIPGNGFGPNGVFELAYQPGHVPATAIVPTPGRGIQLSPGSRIGPTDGCIGPGPIGVRDCTRQSAVDLFALFRTIQSTGGLGLGLNPSRVYYVGQSFGSFYGTLFHSIEPGLKAAILNVGGGTATTVSRLAITARPLAAFYLATSDPPLLNVPPAPSEAYFHDSFNDNYVFRNMAPVINNLPGAETIIAVDNALEIADWLDISGDPLAFAFNLKNQVLPGIIGKSTLVQFAFGDLEVPNPTNSALIRAAGLQSSSWYFRFDLAAAEQPGLLAITLPDSNFPTLPHSYLSNPTIFDADKTAEKSISLAAQEQAALYFAVGGIFIPDPNWFLSGVFAGQTLFQVPTTLPEQLNFIQIKP